MLSRLFSSSYSILCFSNSHHDKERKEKTEQDETATPQNVKNINKESLIRSSVEAFLQILMFGLYTWACAAVCAVTAWISYLSMCVSEPVFFGSLIMDISCCNCISKLDLFTKCTCNIQNTYNARFTGCRENCGQMWMWGFRKTTSQLQASFLSFLTSSLLNVKFKVKMHIN